MKKTAAILIMFAALTATCCYLFDEEVVNIRVYGHVKDKLTNDPLEGCSIYINNGYIDEDDEYAASTDAAGYYEFNRDVWKHYSTEIRAVYPDIDYKLQVKDINNKKNNEVNFFLEKY